MDVGVCVACMNNLNNVKLSAADACNMYAKTCNTHTRINKFFRVYPPPESPTCIIIRSNENVALFTRIVLITIQN